jgi:hypothetical protein
MMITQSRTDTLNVKSSSLQPLWTPAASIASKKTFFVSPIKLKRDVTVEKHTVSRHGIFFSQLKTSSLV